MKNNFLRELRLRIYAVKRNDKQFTIYSLTNVIPDIFLLCQFDINRS